MQAPGQAKYETTASLAETESSTTRIADNIHNNAESAQYAAKDAASEARNHPQHTAAQPASGTTTAAQAVARSPQLAATAEHTKGVAEHAASVAHEKGPGVTGDPKDVIPQAKATTDRAVEQGKKDVSAALVTGQSYVQQAIGVASGAITSAQQYISGGGKQTSSDGVNTGSVLETASHYATQAQHVVQPHVEAAAKAIQSGASSAVQSAQGYLNTSNEDTPPSVPSKTAPLESGSQITEDIYPEGGNAKNLGKTA